MGRPLLVFVDVIDFISGWVLDFRDCVKRNYELEDLM